MTPVSERESSSNALPEGVIVKGQTVTVAKGRKVPLGTTGVVFWTGTDSYDTVKAGFRTADGEKFFTAVSNLKSHTS